MLPLLFQLGELASLVSWALPESRWLRLAVVMAIAVAVAVVVVAFGPAVRDQFVARIVVQRD